ncbi:MAG TPA: phosphohistidine phosphatase SixA [Rhodospirillales bacterium]|jgi:phosphohistidine phosphatase|nr:phosphohistidine phosphatase SixA [Rhodospirillales bacterium]
MRLYLVQHAEAFGEAENPERPLSDKGLADIQRVAAFLGRGRMRVGRVIHSGKTRARETARFLADVVSPGTEIEEAAAGLAPNNSTDLFVQAIGNWLEDVASGVEAAGDAMLVGHLPFMGKLASLLVAGAEEVGVVAFTPGTVLCLEHNGETGDWAIAWMASPELLGQ